MFSVVAVKLLPDVTRVHDLFEIGWTFAAGLMLMLLVEQLGKRLGSLFECRPFVGSRYPFRKRCWSGEPPTVPRGTPTARASCGGRACVSVSLLRG